MTAISDCQSDLVVGKFHTRLFVPLVQMLRVCQSDLVVGIFHPQHLYTGKKSLVWKIPTTRSDWQSEIAVTYIQILIY